MQAHDLMLLFIKTKFNELKKTWCYFCLIFYYSTSIKEGVKLIEILEKLKNSLTSKQQGANKSSFTKNFKRLVNAYGIGFARNTYLSALGIYLLEKPDDHLLQFLYRRIEPKMGDYFRYGKDTYAWFDEAFQVMAERIPLYVPITGEFKKVDFENFYYERDYWNKRGFYEAEPLAYDYKVERFNVPSKTLEIHVDRKDLEEYGFARPEIMPLLRNEQLEDGEKVQFWRVIRNIKEFGFWNSYKWWAGCGENWYFEHHPEWFTEDYHERARMSKEDMRDGALLLQFKRNAAIIDSFILRRGCPS